MFNKYRRQLVAGLAIAFAVYLVLLLFVNLDELLRSLQVYPWLLLVPVLVLKVVAWGLHFLKWQYYLGLIGARASISVLDSLVLFLAGFTLVISPGKSAEVLKAVVLKVKTNTPVSKGVSVVLAERVADGISVLLIAFAAALLAGAALDIGPYRWVLLVGTALLAVGLVAVQIRPLAYFFLNLIPRLPLLRPLLRRLHAPLVDFYESSRALFSVRPLLVANLLGGSAYALDALGMTVVLLGFGLEFSLPLFFITMFIFGFAAAAGALSGSPNGVGVTELSTAGLYTALMMRMFPALSSGDLAVAVVLNAFLYKWLRVLVGLLVALIFHRRLFSASLDAALAEAADPQTRGAAA